jgi:ABC-2 type transport system permease protein
MREILIIIQREFLERVRTRTFVLSTLLLPAMVILAVALPTLMDRGGGERTIVVVDEAPGSVGEQVAALLTTPRDDAAATPIVYQVERVDGSLAAMREALNARVRGGEIDGYLWLPPGVVADQPAEFRARNVGNFQVNQDLRRALSDAVRAERLRVSGMEIGEILALVRPAEMETARITERGGEGGTASATFGAAYGAGFLAYIFIVIFGQNVMRSVLEEKTNRIVEVLVSSVRATHVMAGKILGVGAVALLQLAIWAVFLVAVLSQARLISERFGVPPEALRALRVEPMVGLALAGFFIGGFLLYAAMFAAVGAAVSTEQEAQQMVMVVLLPLFVPLLFIMPVITDPQGRIAVWLGTIPFTSPMVMPMRMGASDVPVIEIAGSLLLMVVAVVAVTWIAGRIYRVGILSTGKRPSLRELGRWLRTA